MWKNVLFLIVLVNLATTSCNARINEEDDIISKKEVDFLKNEKFNIKSKLESLGLGKSQKCPDPVKFEAMLSKLKKKNKLMMCLKDQCHKPAEGLTLVQSEFGTYYFNIDNNFKLNWFGAAEHCRALGMELVSLETKEEADCIAAKFMELTAAEGSGEEKFAWIGLSTTNNGFSPTWTGTGKTVPYYDWHYGEPDGSGNCGKLVHKENKAKWADEFCFNLGRFICEVTEPCKQILRMC